ncbi:winged helix-turn-helix transcriptional regulator [Gordonia sp. TBRC 11910]|uniref:Winged helix-turn-helix transcriptional regulator n=1 Tax=Gordonia asplenii TaxID=2725283 RepID=A0A848KNC0_9ACTN|nr:MarR family winged helix-turn-helix transcriptional regulator [Gordonia asplenii]NMO00544.1 winged helix-turn-helix transcriptional regulator [Gordonia asplenii]
MPDPTPTPEEVWNLLVHIAFDDRDGWRRAVAEHTGVAFSRIRVLKRLARSGPTTLKDLAHASAMDQPATTVAINELEARGMVIRDVDAADRRRKLVSITDVGREVIAKAHAVPDPAPAALREFDVDDLAALRKLLRRLEK